MSACSPEPGFDYTSSSSGFLPWLDFHCGHLLPWMEHERGGVVHYFFTWTTGHTEVDALLHQAVLRWERMAADSNALTFSGELAAPQPHLMSPDIEIPESWASTFYLLSHPEQVVLAFAWLHWWQQSAEEEEPGFAGWLRRGPGFALNHVSLLKVLTQQCSGVLGVLHRFLETIAERAGDWDGDREEGGEIVKLLEGLDIEYRYNVHDRELWPAVFQLVQEDEPEP